MELNKIFKGSVACVLALMVTNTSLNAEYLSSLYKPSKTEKTQKSSTKNYISNKKYTSLCDNIFVMNDTYWTSLIIEKDYFNQFDENKKIQEKQKIKKMIKVLTKVIAVAKKRIESPTYKDLKNENEKVYYSSLAVKQLLEEITNEEFMRLTGGIDALKVEYFDIMEYGKGIEEAGEVLRTIA